MRWCLLVPIMAFVLQASQPAAAQAAGPRPSQSGSVSQQVNQTTITVTYSRPVARGRELFGALVPFGKVWTPGANEATELTVSTAVRVNGQPLPAGTYSVWAVPGATRWDLILNTTHPVFHLAHQEVAASDLLTVTATPRAGPHMETLAWYFPVVDGRKARSEEHTSELQSH